MSDNESCSDITRRDAVKVGTATAVGAAVAVRLGKLRPAFAAGTDEIRVGLIGCGGRGTGAATQALQAAKGVRLVAVADAFPNPWLALVPLGLTTARRAARRQGRRPERCARETHA